MRIHLIDKISTLITSLSLHYTLAWKLEAKIHISLLVVSWRLNSHYGFALEKLVNWPRRILLKARLRSIMPCPSTGSKMFGDGPNVLGWSKCFGLKIVLHSVLVPKILCWHKNQISWPNLNRLLVWHNI